MNIPNQLKNAIENDDLVIFAGSGISRSYGLPNWKEMVQNIIQSLGDENEYSDFLPLLLKNKLKPREILDKLQNEHGEVRKYIKENFHIKHEIGSVHRQILELSNQIITTNYDNAFELASDGLIIPATHTSAFNLSEINRSNDSYILKLHGSVSEVDHCLIFSNDYDNLYKQDTGIIEKLKSIFSTKTILFIGFSFQDDEINFIFNKLDHLFANYNKHFVLTTNSSNILNYDFLIPITIDNYDLLPEFINNCCAIKPVVVKLKEEMFKSAKAKIAFLCPDPIDIDFNNEFQSVRSSFESLDLDIFYGTLNLSTLNEIDDFDLLVVITKTFKSMVYIETENMKSDLITIKDLRNAIPDDSIPLVMITDNRLDQGDMNNGIFISSFKNSIISRFIFKALKNLDLNFYDQEIFSNTKHWLKSSIQKGNANIKSIYSTSFKNLELDKKSIASVVGRVEEQITIATRLLGIIKTDKFLNIKASGGIGKTTLVKKVAAELFMRGYFKDGVSFKSCENIKNYEDFEDLVIQGFNLLNIISFKEYLLENFSFKKKDQLIILDNFETVVNNLNEDDFAKAVELLKFCTGFANLALTSREIISSARDFEEVYALTPLTTDDAFQLFVKNYGNIREDEHSILKHDILEDILNNNPLAIKLVTNSRTKFRHISELKQQLTNNFFESINEDYSIVFNVKADLNIERTRSIFQCINYSYITLTNKEKLAFELLSLFPDGIALSNFKKCFKNRNSKNDINDTELRVLRDKSLVEDENGTLKLQPIIRRFADYKFSQRPDEVKKKYCSDAYSFNAFMLDVLYYIQSSKSLSIAYRFYNGIRNNLLKVLDYFGDVEFQAKDFPKDKGYFLGYIYELEDYIINEKQILEFIRKLDDLKLFFDDLENASALLEGIRYRITYFHHEFDKSYNKLCELYSVDEMENRDFVDEPPFVRSLRNAVSSVHGMEGHTFKLINTLAKSKSFCYIPKSELFYLGIPITPNKDHLDFYHFESRRILNKLDISQLESYLGSLYQDEHLERIQCTYILSKVKTVSSKEVKKLVTTNPYTIGLKELMFAFVCKDEKSTIGHFEKALKHLKHIKYFYLEGLYYYTKYLIEVDMEYEDKLKQGSELSKEFYYQYLVFQFSNIKKKTNENVYELDYSSYPINGLEEYIKDVKVEWQKIIDKYD